MLYFGSREKKGMKLLGISGLLLWILSAQAMAAPKVVVTIKPLHSIVAAVMEGVAEPELLLDGNQSPHIAALKPSQRKTLARADVIFYVDGTIEQFMPKLIDSLEDSNKAVALGKIPSLVRYPQRGVERDAHNHAHDHAHAHGTGDDMHVWLDPANALMIAQYVADYLIVTDAANKTRYRANLQVVQDRYLALAFELREKLSPVQDKPILVFHDAYQYFEKAFGITVASVISLNPGVSLSAKRIDAIRNIVKNQPVFCLISEPQFTAKLIDLLHEEFEIPKTTLDPLGVDMPTGPQAYAGTLRNMAEALVECVD